jgi:hypothetical protein
LEALQAAGQCVFQLNPVYPQVKICYYRHQENHSMIIVSLTYWLRLMPSLRLLAVFPSTESSITIGSNSYAAADNTANSSSTTNSIPRQIAWRRHFGYWWPAYAILVLLGATAGVAMLVVVEKTGASQLDSGSQSQGDKSDLSELQNDLFYAFVIYSRALDPFAFLRPRLTPITTLTWFVTIPQDPTLWEEEQINAQQRAASCHQHSFDPEVCPHNLGLLMQ